VRFLVDECAGPAVGRWLRRLGHEVFSVYEEARGAADEDILRKAYAENWILITNDKDFGEQVYRLNRLHRGVVLLRLDDETSGSKINALQRLLRGFSAELADQFVVVTDTQVRFARLQR
jgi:predicted nuclease of predicted toxin-antitoxin system